MIPVCPCYCQHQLPDAVCLRVGDTGQYKYALLSSEWFYAHCKAVIYVCAYSALAMSPGSVKAMYGKHCRPQHLWIFLFTFITFTCASLEAEGPSERVTAFHLHIETPEEVVVLLSVLYHFYCKVTLQLSLSTKADTNTHTHTHLLSMLR